MARIVSVNVGRARQVPWRGRTVRTAFFKEPVGGRVRVLRDHVEGDEAADRRYHGGERQAVYVYPADHYSFWRSRLGRDDVPWGSFGENLSVEGVDEASMRIGDRLRAGTATLRVTKPRMPCYKMGIRFDDETMVDAFQEAARPGFYCAVDEEGDVAAGDEVTVEAGAKRGPTVVDDFRRRLRRGDEG